MILEGEGVIAATNRNLSHMVQAGRFRNNFV